MEETKESEKREKRKEAVKNWLKDKHNLIFIAVLIFAVIVYLYNFNLTKTQALWWDEADYLAYAKNLAGYPVDWIVSVKHNSLYSYIAAAFFKFGIGEAGIKFFLQVLPAILSVALAYFISNKMYKDKRIGFIVSFLMSVFWVSLFNTSRFHVDIPALFFGLLAIYIFWKGYENKEKIFGKIDSKWTIPLTVALVILAYTIRRGYIIFGAFFLVYMLASKKVTSLIKDKYNWIALGLALILFFLAEKSIFISQITDISGAYFHEENPINFLPLQVFPAFFDSVTKMPSVLLYLFWIGAALLLANITLSFNILKKENSTKTRADLFNILTIIITLAFFIYVLRSPDNFGEARWYLPLALSAFICISRATLSIADYIKPYSKYASIIFIVVLVTMGGYYELKQGNDAIKSKLNSFQGIRDASLYIKENSNSEDKVITISRPQVAYYAERKVVLPSELTKWQDHHTKVPFELVLEGIKNDKTVKYILVSFSEPNHPEWMKKEYFTDNGQIAAWEIPFMETKIDFINKRQDIKKEKVYEGMTFKLIVVKNEVFVYEILR